MNFQPWYVSVLLVGIYLLTTISMTIADDNKKKREKIVRITIEHVEVPNIQQSIADIKRAPASQKQVLVLKEKEKGKKREEKKKKLEKKIISRLSNLLAKVKDIKQRHFHHGGGMMNMENNGQGQEKIPSAEVVHHRHHHHHKSDRKQAARKRHQRNHERPLLHLPNEGMESGDNVDVNLVESSGENAGEVPGDDILSKAVENDKHFGNQLNLFEDGVDGTDDSPATTVSNTSNSVSDGYKNNQSASDGLNTKQRDENSYKILVKDYELSSGAESEEDQNLNSKQLVVDPLHKKFVEKDLTYPSDDSQLFTNISATMGKTNVNVTSQDDFEVVNGNENFPSQQKYTTQSVDISMKERPNDWGPVSRHSGDHRKPDSRQDYYGSDVKPVSRNPGDDSNIFRHFGSKHDGDNEPKPTTKYSGDKNDWGNGTPTVSSEDKRYWNKEKKTKANINNVNHKLKDFSANFFTVTMRHEASDETDESLTENVERKNTTVSTTDVSSANKTNNATSIENNSILNFSSNGETLTEDSKILKNTTVKDFSDETKNNTLFQPDTLSNETFGDSGVSREPAPITNRSRNVELVDINKPISNVTITKDDYDDIKVASESKSQLKQDLVQLVVESERAQQPVRNNSNPATGIQNSNNTTGLQIANIRITKINETGTTTGRSKANETNTKNSTFIPPQMSSNDTPQQDFTKRLKSRLQLMSEKRQFSFNQTNKMAEESSRLIVVTPSRNHVNGHIREIDEFCSMKVTGSYADPYDCSKYWLCAGGKKYETHCPGDLVYNNIISSCDDPKTSKNQVALTCI